MLTAEQIREHIRSQFAVLPFSIGVTECPKVHPKQQVFWTVRLYFDGTEYPVKAKVKNALRHLVCGMFAEEDGVMVD